MKQRILFILLSITLLFNTFRAQVKVVEDSLFSPSIRATMKFYAVLPDGYEKNEDHYTTIYLLHGLNGNYKDWVTLTNLVHYASKHHFILITPDGDNSWYTNSMTKLNANYEGYVINDLIPFADSKYRTIRSKYGRAIAGLSMGGYGAAKFSLKYPSLFFFAGCLSPAIQFPYGLEDSAIVKRRTKESLEKLHDIFGSLRNENWQNEDVFKLVEKAESKTIPYFYLSVGSQDGIPEIINLTHKFAASLRKQGIPFEMHESAGSHDWKFWNKEIETVLNRIDEHIEKK
ncbi:MAG: alpha/beta hydrolase family protein [Bacteroidota bacterium]|nr:alpha/beta hydrolase family protein [Bacteroidota bacterium]